MTTSSEDVLLQMAEIKYKKGDGTLYVMNERLAWMAENRDTVAVSHRFQDIKMQKISPEGKPKVQLQVVLHDGNSSTFHFANRNGMQAQIQDRDKVKELLQQLLPNFKRKVDRELEEKNKILSENPSLLQLYKDLVITQVLTSEEFWNTHAKKHTQKKHGSKQDIGVSGAFLADIKPIADGCNGFKYNLTGDIIDSIFKAYPAVKKKYQEYVPSKMKETEFWTKFFQSHYFHRDRLTTGGPKDLFSECSKIDDNAMKKAVAQGTGDLLIELNEFEDNMLEEGFCSSANEKIESNSGNIVHQCLIKRFNQHSMMVLNTCTKMKPPESTMQIHNKEESNGHTSNDTVDNHDEPNPKKSRLIEKIVYEDLVDDPIETVSNGHTELSLSKVDRYCHGPVIAPIVDHSVDPNDLETVQMKMLQETEGWKMRTPHKVLVNPKTAVHVLGELSPGGALMRGYRDLSATQLVSPEVEKEIRNLYLSLSELLRHFWQCFPPTTPELESKLVRMHEAIQRFQMVKLKPFEEKMVRELAPLGTSLTQHLNELLQTASRKFVTWQDRKLRQHR